MSWLVSLIELAPLGKKREPEKLETAFHNSLLRVFAYHGETLVGAGRALSDGVRLFMMWQSCRSIRARELEA